MPGGCTLGAACCEAEEHWSLLATGARPLKYEPKLKPQISIVWMLTARAPAEAISLLVLAMVVAVMVRDCACAGSVGAAWGGPVLGGALAKARTVGPFREVDVPRKA